MSKIIDYQIVEYHSGPGIEQEVLKLISDGWQPLGGLCYNRGVYHQAMVKYETPYRTETSFMGKKVSELNDDEFQAFIDYLENYTGGDL